MLAAVFPGQGSQKPGMGQSLAEAFPEAAKVFDEVSVATGIDVRNLCWNSDEDTLRATENAQLALFTCGVAAWSALNAQTQIPWTAVAGHSVGEYAALVAAGVFSVDVGARLVRARGELMAKAGQTAPGTMAAILGLEKEKIEQACEAAAGAVVVANDNSPGQIVISGEVDAVARAGQIASEMGAKRVIPLNVSGAFHSPLMEAPAREMGKRVRDYSANPAQIKVYANVTAEPVTDAYEWPDLLERQLQSPVRWTESVQNMMRDGATTFVECGVGEVLCGLIRRIDKSAVTHKVFDAESLATTLAALAS